MCGIAGFIGFDNYVPLARAANEIQKHRGPDNQTVWHDDYIALAHQRLSIIDLSCAANQPFHKGDYVIVFNGEIYNYKQLQERLKKEHGVEFNTTSDTEVILEMYVHYGAECLDHLIGMFAFALYHKSDKTLFMARDHFGIKPFFYTVINGAFAFSSELKALVGVPGFTKRLNPKALVSSLNYRWVSGNDTMFENCYKLPPAHYMTFSPEKGVVKTRYWDLEDTLGGMGNTSQEDEIESISKLMAESAQRHLVADVPVSAFLSGGLDSSLVCVLAQKINSRLSTYTIGTSTEDKKGESMPDDEKYADIIAREYGLDHHVITIRPNILEELPHMVKTLDEPIGDAAAINTYLICKAAREKGVKVLLSGMGADEMFFGYRRQKATLLALQYNKLPGFMKAVINDVVNALPVKIGKKGITLTRWAKRFLGFASMPLEKAYMRSYSYYDSNELKQLLNKAYWTGIDDINAEHERLFNARFKNDPINQMCHTDLSMFMLGLNLTYTDRASMAASVEVRVPFIDKLVITKAMKLPGVLKYKKNQSKYILKKAAEKTLPKKIIYRPKASFMAPLRSWISKDLKGMVDDLLSKENVNRRGLLNYSFVKKLIDEDRAGRQDYAYQIYQLLTLELWCREYLDK